MKHLFFRRMLAFVLILALSIGNIPSTAFAVEAHYSDTAGHWALKAIERWSDYGVLNGHAGLFHPDEPITRAEMATVLANVNGYIAVGNNQFSDIDSGKWYYENVLKLATAGIMLGFDGKARPEDKITREEAATLLARTFDIPDKAYEINPFKDEYSISAWSAGYVHSLRAAGYISGRPSGNFDAKESITRAEVVTILDNMVKAFYNAKGEYSGNISGNALVRTDGIILNNMKISGSLYLTEGIGLGEVTLIDVIVEKTTHILGGGTNSIQVTGGDLGEVELNSFYKTHLALSSNTKASKINMLNTGTVTQGDVKVAFEATTGVLTLGGTIDKAVMKADGTMSITASGIEYEITQSKGVTLKLALADGSIIKEMSLSAPLHIIGTGRIDKMEIHTSGTVLDNSVIVKLENITLGKDVSVTIGGKIFAGTGGTLKVDDSVSSRPTPTDTVTVAFQTNGGSELSLLQVPRGETLPAIPMPIKENYAFIGWYTDQNLNNEFYSDLAIGQDMILYARYTERDGNMRVYVDPNKYVENFNPNDSISILSSVTITSENLMDYVELKSYLEELPSLRVYGAEGEYTLLPEEPYVGGGLYELTLKSEELSFKGEDVAVRKLSYRIHKDETKIIELVDGLIYVLWVDVADLGQGAYAVPAAKYDIEAGDTVCFWNEVYDDHMKYRNIVLATPIKDEDGNGDVLLLNTEASNPEDVFDKMDIYVEQGIPIEDYLDQIDTKKIEQDVKNSAGARQITAILNQAIVQSPTIQALVAEEIYFKSPSETTEHRDIPVELLFKDIEDLEVTCIVGGTDNANFPTAFNPETAAASEWGKDYSPVMTLTLKYSTVIKEKINVEAEITIKEYLSASLQGGGNIKGMDNFDFDYAINLYSQTDIFMTVLVKSVNQSPEYAYNIDVTKEINKLLQGNAESEDDDPAEILKKVLGDKGDYIDLVEANIIDIPVKIIPELPIAEFHIKLDFVIKANFAAGISSETTLLTARQIGIAGNSREGYLVTYDHELFGNNRYAIDIYAAGYVGFKTGLKGTMTISFFGLEDLGKLGTSLEFGAYIDLYGFAHATIRKTYPNDYIYSGKKGITLDGAIYMELGLYLETELFVESKTFSARAGLTVLDLKFPLLSVGDRYVLSKFLNNETHILMNTESLQLNSSNGLLAAEFIDLKTGEKVTGSFADPSKFAVGYSSPYLSTENNAININKTLLGSNIKRLDVTAYIYYNGSALTFTGPREIYFDINGQPYAIETPKTVKLTWIDSSIDASQFSGIDTAKATYVVNIDGKETVLYERTVLLAEIPGSIDLSSYMQSHKITGYDNDFNVPIIRDTIYKINMTPYQRLISYITYYDGEWHFEVYPLNSGEKPVPPAKYNSTPEMGFKEWFVASGYWGYTRGNYYFNEVIPMEAALRYGNDNVFVGLDTTKSLYSISGTLTDCYNAYYQGTYNGKSFNFLSLARYEAEYQQRENCTVTIRYPAMEYIVMGRTVKYGTSTWTNSYRFGGSIVIPSSYWFAYNGCEMLGWDTNGDGIVDYDPKNPPIAGSDMTFTAVMKVKTFDVTMQDHNGIPVGRVTVNIGNLPDILSTSPEHPDGDANKFMHWEVSKGGREFVKWDKWTNPGVYEGWTVRPVYSREFKVTFLNGSDISFTVLLPVGTYNASDYVWFTPTKDSDEDYYYNFSGWDSGDNFTVTGDMTITALFTPFPILYTIKFTTPYGELSTGGKTHTIMSTYGEYAEVAKAYIDANNTFEPVYTDDRVYTFTSWGPVEIDIIDRVGVTVEYTAIWSYEIRNYTITFDGGEGYYKSTGQKTYTINDFIYGTTASLFGEDSFVRDEDDYNTYVFTGWRDQLGVIHLPGATYTVTGDMTYTAVYGVLTEKTYTVTFDANGGVFPENPDIDFPEGESIITITCSYGYVITGIPEPTKAADSIYTYTFIGWEPDIVPVTGNAAYTAKYSRQYEVELPTGLKISDGTTTEDINMGTISGYTYTMEMNYYNVYVPTLTITGNGLTVSGIPDISGESWNLPDVVRIFITKEVTDVCFKGLTLWTDNDHLIYIEGEDGSEAITVTFSDKSSFYNYGAYDSGGYRYSFAPIESERDIVLISSDTEATLSLSTEAGASALICGGDATIRNLNLTINMRITQIDGISDNWGRFPAAFHNGKYEMSNWSFIDSVVTVDTDGRGFGSSGFGSIGTIDISGCQFSITSAFEYIESADNLIITNSNFNFLGKSRLGSWGEDNVLDTGASDGIISGTVLIQGKSYVSLIADVVEIAVLKTDLILFEDFMGTFEVSYLDPEITFLTVYTNSGIKFLIESNEVDPLDHYDLGGAKIGWVTAIDDPTYYTFVNDVDAPLSEVLIRQKELALKYLHQ